MRHDPRPDLFALCVLLGHDDHTRREPRRLSLECRRCGRTTAGWTLGLAETPDRLPADPVSWFGLPRWTARAHATPGRSGPTLTAP